ncbi:MAG: hypothetical protein ACLUMQ_05370 [Streptococcus salivarius]
MTLFLYPDDSTRKGELLRIYQQYLWYQTLLNF